MTFFSNVARLCFCASLLGSVSLIRVSIGLPIRISEAGRAASSSSAIRLAAARQGTPGWHTAMIAARSPSAASRRENSRI